ncbi:MAG: hypothetical protein M1812_007654 [Candelaria pacifica]|nr:MAG: hypothetical protein M1812_007654 [Candelaria pacifica]
MQSLAKQLHSEDVEVRAAAGEAIALLYHSCGISDLDAFLENDQSDESPPASPVRHSRSPKSLRSVSVSAQRHQCQHGSLDSSASQRTHPDGGAADSATHSSLRSREPSSQQACQPIEAESASSHSVESKSDPAARQTEKDSSELTAAELRNSDAHDDLHSDHHKQDQAQLQVSAQQHGHNAQHAQQHSNDVSHHCGADQQLQHSQTRDTSAIESNGHANAQQASSSQPGRNQDTAAEGVTSIQDKGMTKGGRQANRRASSQNPQQKAPNPKQKAEAITNGLDDVVGRMRELATNRGDKSRRSRRDRVSMKSTFRELCNVVEV